MHYIDPDGAERHYERSTEQLPIEPKEIKPHPYGVELGRLAAMLKETPEPTLSSFLVSSFSRVSPAVARRICDTARLSPRARTTRIGRREADALYEAIQQTKISNPATDCISPIGEELILKGLHQVVPGEFYAASTRPPGRLSGQSVSDRGRLGLRRRTRHATRDPRPVGRFDWRRPTPARSVSS